MSNPEKWRGFAPLPDDIQQALTNLPPRLAEAGVDLAYLFGSMVTGAGQDVDIALLMADDAPAYPLREQVVAWLGTKRVDVVDLRLASPVLKFEVISNGRLLHTRTDDTQINFELATLREYQDTNYLRQTQEHLLRERLTTWS